MSTAVTWARVLVSSRPMVARPEPAPISTYRPEPDEAKRALGGAIGLLRTGDVITIDARKRRIDVVLSAAELKRRSKSWKPRPAYTKRGVLAKYARSVSSASKGAITN